MNYYNENNREAAEWLRELMRAGLIVTGDVDERSIVDVRPDELTAYTQCHFFAGIGGWSIALRMAGWEDDEAVWTGSCPCQPLSGIGQGKGHADERHLWPAFHSLVSKRRPATIFGEQVASPDGREWLAGIRADMEGMGYAVGAADLCASGVGAPHRRQRLYWVANSDLPSKHERASSRKQPICDGLRDGLGGMGVTESQGSQRERRITSTPERNQCGRFAGLPGGAWDRWEAVPMRDGKARRIESGSQPLAHGIPGRMGLLRGYGNAIVPQVASKFIEAARDSFR